MRGRSSKLVNKEEMEVEKVDMVKEKEPHLSGAYIRSLVKQLTSSRTKDPTNNPKKTNSGGGGGGDGGSYKEPPPSQQQQQQPPPPQQHKKQVRRRLHTSRPYQERLLNMAEARREIVTALKFHRAAMKKANDDNKQQDYQQQHLPVLDESPTSYLEQETKLKSSRRNNNPRIFASNNSSFNNSSPFLPCPPPPPPTEPNPYFYYSWPISPPPIPDNNNNNNNNFNICLPNQTLGLNLNLNLQDFKNLENPSIYHQDPSFYMEHQHSDQMAVGPDDDATSWLISSSSSSSRPQQQLSSNGAVSEEDGEALGLHHQVMGDEEMEEIRSIGEQHQMEWNDTLNLMTSAWWFKFLKAMEIKEEDDEDHHHHYVDGQDYYSTNNPFDEEAMEFPAWLNPNNDVSFQQEHLNDNCLADYFQDPALPCVEIGEIEGMDGEWLS